MTISKFENRKSKLDGVHVVAATRFALLILTVAIFTPVVAAQHRVLVQGNGKLGIVDAKGQARVGHALGRHP